MSIETQVMNKINELVGAVQETSRSMAEAKDVMALARKTMEEDIKTIADLRSTLIDILDIAQSREDADMVEGRYQPNDWMKVARLCREAL